MLLAISDLLAVKDESKLLRRVYLTAFPGDIIY